MKDWIFFTILTLLLWGFWSFLPKVVVRYIDPYSAMVYQAIGGILVGVGVLIAFKSQLAFNLPGFSLGVVIGLFGFLGAFTYMMAVSKGPLVLVAPLSALYPMLAILMSVVFLHEAVTLKQGIGIAFSLAAIYFIST